MAAGDWYFQVWCHNGLDDIVTEVETFKVEYDAQQRTNILNGLDRYYRHPGFPPPRVFFMQPVLEEHLRVSTAEFFSCCLSEDRELYLKTYDGRFLNSAKQILLSIIIGVKNLHGEEYWRLNDRGGQLSVYHSHVREGGDFKCYVVYTGVGSMLLRMAWENEPRNSMVTVGLFKSKAKLMDWAHDIPVAAHAIEDSLIDLFCDRFRRVERKQGWIETSLDLFRFD